MSGENCCAVVFGDSIRGRACRLNAKVERDGKHYCGTHDPVASAAKRDAKFAAYDAEWAARRQREASRATEISEAKRRADCYDDLLAAISSIVYFIEEGGENAIYTIERCARAAIAKATAA